MVSLRRGDTLIKLTGVQTIDSREWIKLGSYMLCEECKIRRAEFSDEYCGYSMLCEVCHDEEMLSHEAGVDPAVRTTNKESRRYHES